MHSLDAEQVSSNLTPSLMLGYLLGYKSKNGLAWFTSTDTYCLTADTWCSPLGLGVGTNLQAQRTSKNAAVASVVAAQHSSNDV
jgi:hypothetical protein